MEVLLPEEDDGLLLPEFLLIAIIIIFCDLVMLRYYDNFIKKSGAVLKFYNNMEFEMKK